MVVRYASCPPRAVSPVEQLREALRLVRAALPGSMARWNVERRLLLHIHDLTQQDGLTTDRMCKTCGMVFAVTPADTAYARASGRPHLPVRCPTCREARGRRNRERSLAEE